ncbi:MAG: biotin transporter BioY [Rhodospirillaceae bacterium]|nr:biotin transporter BioY [Rhodospirillaceae bacterium]
MTVATIAPTATLVETLWPARRESRAVRILILMTVGVLLLWLSAKIQIPLWPVPLTMQTFVVLTLGLAYGPRLGLATLVAYLAAGAVGLPVFSGGWGEGGGIVHLYGPTAGYLVGFVVAAWICGRLAERGWDRSPVEAVIAMLIGNLVIYVLGVSWLATQIGTVPALQHGLLPFLAGDALKIALGAVTLPLAWHLLGRRAG